MPQIIVTFTTRGRVKGRSKEGQRRVKGGLRGFQGGQRRVQGGLRGFQRKFEKRLRRSNGGPNGVLGGPKGVIEVTLDIRLNMYI